MNPHAPQPLSPLALLRSLLFKREITIQLTQLEVVRRYKGSVFGLLLSFLNPVFMLLVYTFVFAVVFKARWGAGGEETRAQFAVVLFVGLIVHGLFAEV